MSVKKIVSFGTKQFIKRHLSIFGEAPTRAIKNVIAKQLEDGTLSRGENRLSYSISDDGQVEFFAYSNVVLMGEYDRKFLVFPMIYCSSNSSARRKFYKSIRNRAKELSTRKDVHDIAIWCHFDDALSKNHFKSKGTLNMIQLVGDVENTLSVLEEGKTHQIRRLRLIDASAVAKIELLAHKQDTSSRMHQVTGKKNALKKFANFAKMLVKKTEAFVCLDDQRIIGVGAVFPDKKNKVANIATIAVHPRYQGRGVAQSLYREMLSSLKNLGIKKFVGHSSTTAVLGLSKKMKRIEYSRTYTIALKEFIT